MNRWHLRSLPSPIQGQLLRCSDRREVAIFLRERVLWIADFVDGQGAIVDPATWVRFNCGTVANEHARRRLVRESAMPLSDDLVERIERMFREAAASGVAPGPGRDDPDKAANR